jgi:hypothetical protein
MAIGSPGRKEEEVDPELREVRLTLEYARGAAPRRLTPDRVARVQDKPTVPLGDEPVLRRFEQ